MKSLCVSVVMLTIVILASASQAVTITILNSDFEIQDPTGLGPNDGYGTPNVVPSWNVSTTGPAYHSVYDPAGGRLEGDDYNNNWLYQGFTGSSSSTQNVTTLSNNSTYTLTVTVGQDKIYTFPTVGNGVSTGNAFARLLVDSSALQDGSSLVAMPGFLSSTAAAPGGPGNIVNWSVVWTTGSGESLAGKAVYVELAANNANSGEEVFWDNVGLTVTAVPTPEPASAGLLLTGCCGLVVARRVTKSRRRTQS